MPGLFYEEFEVGSVFDHATRRTITEADNVLFSSLTMNSAPLHMDAEYSKQTIYGISRYCFAEMGTVFARCRTLPQAPAHL